MKIVDGSRKAHETFPRAIFIGSARLGEGGGGAGGGGRGEKKRLRLVSHAASSVLIADVS
jgi:hypothetical protein